MKNILLVILVIMVNTLSAQLKIDSTYYSLRTDVFTETTPYSIYTCSYDYLGNDPYILHYDQNLNFIDTLKGSDIGRPNDRFVHPFNFNNGTYVVCQDHDTPSTRDFSIHKIKNGQFTDSIELNLDTISNGYFTHATEVDNNTLRVIIKKSAPGISESRIIDLDSNFNIKAYHNIDFSVINQFIKIITSVYEVNDSLWHVYALDGVVMYNPKKKKTLSGYIIAGEFYKHHKLSSTEYLSLGISSILERPPFQNSAGPSLGFYKVNTSSTFTDTISFNAFSHTTGPNYTKYSREYIQHNNNSIIYDSSNVYLASQGYYSLPNSSLDYRYLHVVKTNFNGTLKWQWIWGNYGSNSFVNFYAIAPTPDLGCVIIGEIRNKSVLIKLGPDGNISNVELDAPETVVSFYPNPVKDKLHYSFLPEAKGPYTLEIVDMQGKPVMEKILDNEKGFVPVQLHAGFYLYNLMDSDGKVQQVGKMLVE